MARTRPMDQYAATLPIAYKAGVREATKTRCRANRRQTTKAMAATRNWPNSTPRLNVNSATGR